MASPAGRASPAMLAPSGGGVAFSVNEKALSNERSTPPSVKQTLHHGKMTLTDSERKLSPASVPTVLTSSVASSSSSSSSSPLQNITHGNLALELKQPVRRSSAISSPVANQHSKRNNRSANQKPEILPFLKEEVSPSLTPEIPLSGETKRLYKKSSKTALKEEG